MRLNYFVGTVVLASIFFISGCTHFEQISDYENSSSQSVTENPFQNYDQDEQNIIENADTSDNKLGVYKPSIKVMVDNDDWYEKSINVRVNSVNVDETVVSGIDYKDINDIYDGLNTDMTLEDDFVFVQINLSLLCDESETYIAEKSYQSEKLYNDDPHRESIINLTANQEKSINVGFVAPKQILESDDIQFIAAFQGIAVEMGENPYEGAATFNLTSEIVKK